MHQRGVSHGGLNAEHVWLVEHEGCGAGLPRLQGFGFGWLRAASNRRGELGDVVEEALRKSRKKVGAIERGADLAALATLARRLLAAAAWGASDDGPEDEGRRRGATVLARALRGDALDRFATPLSFAL